MTFVFEEARNFYGAEQYLMRLGTQLMRKASASAATELASQVLALGNATAVLAAADPSSLIGPFSYNEHNLHPFDQLAGIAATTVGTVYLIIVSAPPCHCLHPSAELISVHILDLGDMEQPRLAHHRQQARPRV